MKFEKKTKFQLIFVFSFLSVPSDIFVSTDRLNFNIIMWHITPILYLQQVGRYLDLPVTSIDIINTTTVQQSRHKRIKFGMLASLADYLNRLHILYLGSRGQRLYSNRLPIRLPKFVGPTNFPSYYLDLLGQQKCLPIYPFISLTRTYVAPSPSGGPPRRCSSPAALLSSSLSMVAVNLPAGGRPSPAVLLPSTTPFFLSLHGGSQSSAGGRDGALTGRWTGGSVAPSDVLIGAPLNPIPSRAALLLCSVGAPSLPRYCPSSSMATEIRKEMICGLHMSLAVKLKLVAMKLVAMI